MLFLNIKFKSLYIYMFLVISTFLSPVFDSYYESNTVITTTLIFLLGITLWISSTLPASLTGVIVIVLFPLLNVLTFKEAAIGLGSPVVWLVISVLILSHTITTYKIDLRIAYNLLILSKGKQHMILLILIIISFALNFIIPSAVARLTILLSVTEGILENNNKSKQSNFYKACMLIVTYAPYMGAIAVLTGSTGAMYAAGLFSEILNYEWTYMYWLILMLPGSILSLLALWIILLFVYPVKTKKISLDNNYFYEEKKKLGTMDKNSYKFLFIFISLIVLWATTSLHSLSIYLVSTSVITLLFIPGIDLMDWKKTLQKIDWGIPFLFAAGLSLAKAFDKSGILNIISSFVAEFANGKSTILFVLSILLTLIFIRLFFTNLNAIVAIIFPIVLSVSQEISINPLWFGMIALSVMSLSYILPTQSIGYMIMISGRYYRPLDLVKIGIPLTIITLMIFLVLSLFYWPMVGLKY